MANKPKVEKIHIDLSSLTIGDLEIIDKASRNELPITELVDVLDRAVKGGARHLPVTALNDITEALGKAFAAVAVASAHINSAEAEGN